MVKLNNEAKRIVAFYELQRGDTFRHADYVYIKTEAFRNERERYNAVCLTDGVFGCFHTDDRVEVVDVEATLK